MQLSKVVLFSILLVSSVVLAQHPSSSISPASPSQSDSASTTSSTKATHSSESSAANNSLAANRTASPSGASSSSTGSTVVLDDRQLPDSDARRQGSDTGNAASGRKPTPPSSPENGAGEEHKPIAAAHAATNTLAPTPSNKCPANGVWNGHACLAKCIYGTVWNGLTCVKERNECTRYVSQAAEWFSGLRDKRIEMEIACSKDPKGNECKKLIGEYSEAVSSYEMFWDEAPLNCQKVMPVVPLWHDPTDP